MPKNILPEKILLKDLLFNRQKIVKISGEIANIYHEFKRDEFVNAVIAEFPKLELKERISCIAKFLKQYLPNDYRQALEILLLALPKPNNPDLADDDFGDFIYASYGEFVAINGCNKQDLNFSLEALYQITQRFSAEDAIRYFINAFPKETLLKLQKWSKDDNYHVRRLCSEGTRPKLPWSHKINIEVEKPITILDNLFSDSKRYITRSVANHINDIAKIDADLAIKTIKSWQKSSKQDAKEMDYITRHGLRSLIKKGDSEALKLVGVSSNANIEIIDFKLAKQAIKINDFLEFSLTVRAHEEAKIIIDYAIYFQGKMANKKKDEPLNKPLIRNNYKVFKLKTLFLPQGQNLVISKRHHMRANMTTRKIFAGEHRVEIKVNGNSCGVIPFFMID